jgi:hypothetical protein
MVRKQPCSFLTNIYLAKKRSKQIGDDALMTRLWP